MRRQRNKEKKNNNKEVMNINNKKQRRKTENSCFGFFQVLYKEIFVLYFLFYISAFIRSDDEIDEGRIFTLGVTKSPSLALPEGECDDGGTTAAVG